ncbi:MAG: hypothetical protein ACR2IL_04520 [Chitinophagaceae bacterium]
MITTTERSAMKKEIIQRLLTINDEPLREKVNGLLLLVENIQAENELSNAEIGSIRQGLSDATAGKLHPHENVKTVYGRWL